MALNEFLWIVLFALGISSPFLLGFLFAVLYKHVKPKILWFTLWFLILAIMIGGIIQLSSFILLDDEAFGYAYPFLSILSASLFLVLYFICFWFSRIFNIKRKRHWLCLLLIPPISLGALFLTFWVTSQKHWGYIEDKALQKEALENAQGTNYDIEQEFRDAWRFTYSTVIFRERSDSAFYRTIHSVCSKQDDIDSISNSWIPLDKEKTELVKKLKKSIEDYKPEATPGDVLDGYGSCTALNDYERNAQRILCFGNAIYYGARRAIAIENLANQIRTEPEKREAFTTLSNEKVKQKCKEMGHE